MQRVLSFLKQEAVLSIAALCALVSMIFVPPSATYLTYIDVRVLCLLFCLMAVVAGFHACGVFEVLAQKLLRGEKDLRLLSLVLVLLPFFSSMLITNDVALITFVPFTLLILEMAQAEDKIIPVVILQTIAANLGSMATPVGNPQNLFLCANYTLSASDFFGTLLPYTVLSLVILSIAAVVGRTQTISVTFPKKATLTNYPLLMVLTVLFLLCLLSVFHIVPYLPLTVLTVAVLLLLGRQLLLKVDYSLLLTFVFFFIFSGNLGEIPAVSRLLSALMEKNALITSALASQIISNVPAAVLLSGFTENWRALLLGTDLGGLGTPIASLASLISLKYYIHSKNSRVSRYLLWFTIINFLLLLIFLVLASLFSPSASC